VLATAEEIFDDKVEQFLGKDIDPDDWDLEAFKRELAQLFALTDADFSAVGLENKSAGEMREDLWERTAAKYAEKEQVVPPDLMRRVERDLMLQIVDGQWKDHLYSLDHLKEGIGLRGYGQRDPLVEYKKESFALFKDMRARIEEEIVRYLWWLRPVVDGDDGSLPPVRTPRTPPRRPPQLNYNDPSAARAQLPAAGASRGGGFPGPSGGAPTPPRVGGDDAPIKTVRREEPKIGRNDPCWCGSGKKFKKCHGA
jgi:preprotein translocase subunit SecA